MRVIYNKLIPFKGFIAINLFGVMFARKEYEGKISKSTITHELIHTAQMREMLYIGFYLCYLIEWLVRLPFGNAYRRICFECEAYEHQHNERYLTKRKHYEWIRVLFNKRE